MTFIKPNIKLLLSQKLEQYNHIDFINNDPISVPHKFSQKQDIEIAAFFTAIFSWGNRKNIINSANRFMQLMNNNPYEFILDYQPKKHNTLFAKFAHRTFGYEDCKIFLKFLHHHFKINNEKTLETAFTKHTPKGEINIENALNGFYNYFFSNQIHGNEHELRKKHIGAPFKKSACKRINMFLRWMVRHDKHGVDFGLWKNIAPSQLIIPLDVHVLNVAIKLELLPPNAKANWENAVLLTNILKQLNPNDPVAYDYALFSLGVVEKVK
jgi:uncharacterized protein (TIGR02757 family)